MPATQASDYLRDVLAQYGLDNLTTWAMQQLTQGQSQEQVMISMRQQPEFQARFPAIKARTDQGLAPLTPAQYIEYERNTRQLMMSAGLPSGFYDSPDDFTDLLTKDVSLNELTQRVQSGFDRVNSAPPEVTKAFETYYGANGKTAMAQFFLDPEKALPDLMRQAEAAVFGGAGGQQGIGVSRDQAELASRMGVTQDQAQKGFGQLNQERNYYDELFTDTKDLSQSGEGVAATFGMDAEAERAVQRRKQERQAAFAGSGGVQQGQQGLAGTGAATK